MVRNVILHYHIFKHAGSTIDLMLQRSFGDGWTPLEGELATSKISPSEISEFIQAHPGVQAISSHHALLPPPVIEGVEVFPILLLRHPIDRVRSVYEFERRQGLELGPISIGAEHAAKLEFRDYLRWRLDRSVNGVVHNVQVMWLLHHPRYHRLKIRSADFERAWEMLNSLPFFGLVERFDESMLLVQRLLHERGVEFGTEYEAVNRGGHHHLGIEERLASMRTALGEDAWSELESRNEWDVSLYRRASEAFQCRMDGLNSIETSAS